MLKHHLSIPHRKVTLAVAEMHQEITSPDHAQQLILRGVSYLLIPGHKEALTLDTDHILCWILPFSTYPKNIRSEMLIDIALPYTYHNQSRQTTTVLARYLLFGHKLIGIKVCGCKDWPIDKV